MFFAYFFIFGDDLVTVEDYRLSVRGASPAHRPALDSNDKRVALRIEKRLAIRRLVTLASGLRFVQRGDRPPPFGQAARFGVVS